MIKFNKEAPLRVRGEVHQLQARLRLLTVQQVGLTAVSGAYSYVHDDDGAMALRFGPSPGRVYEALVNLGVTSAE